MGKKIALMRVPIIKSKYSKCAIRIKHFSTHLKIICFTRAGAVVRR
jgi:hypothetical protein